MAVERFFFFDTVSENILQSDGGMKDSTADAIFLKVSFLLKLPLTSSSGIQASGGGVGAVRYVHPSILLGGAGCAGSSG